jgi:hypothetical protein
VFFSPQASLLGFLTGNCIHATIPARNSDKLIFRNTFFEATRINFLIDLAQTAGSQHA